jgi:hypothetical protein
MKRWRRSRLQIPTAPTYGLITCRRGRPGTTSELLGRNRAAVWRMLRKKHREGKGSMKTKIAVRLISVSINRPASEVYEFVSNPENLPQWATGLGGSINEVKGEWTADTPMGKAKIRFVEKNQFGIPDHDVILESGVTVHNPMRVLSNGRRGEVIFTLFRQPDVSQETFLEDAKWVEKDLTILRDLLKKWVPEQFNHILYQFLEEVNKERRNMDAKNHPTFMV